MTDFLKVEDFLQINVFLYDVDFVDGELIGGLAWRSIQKFERSVKLLRYNNQICYVNNINALFKTFRCTTCDSFFSKTGSLEQHLVNCSDRVKHIYSKNVYELRETLFEKLDAIKIAYRSEQRRFKNLAIFDLSLFVSRKQTHTNKLRLRCGSGSMCPYQILSRQTWPRSPFFSATPILIISSRILSVLWRD